MPFVAEAVETDEYDDENDGEAIAEAKGGGGEEDQSTEEAVGEEVEALVGEGDAAGDFWRCNAACAEEDSHPEEGWQEP